jgi:hypothetical protein
MTARNLFNIILKVLGLFFIRDFLAVVPQFLSLISMFVNYSGGGAISPFIASLLSIAAYGFIAYALIFKTEWVIEKLRLEDGFDQESFSLNMHRSTILSIAVIVIGALMVVNALPVSLRQLFLYFQYKRQQSGFINFYPEPDNTILLIHLAEILIGLLLLGNQRKIVAYIEFKRKN